MLLAAGAEGAVRCSAGRAEFRDIERSIGIFLHRSAKPAHYNRVVPLRRPILVDLPVAEAIDHGFDHQLLETARGLWMGDDFGGVLRQLRSRRVQPLEFCHCGWWGITTSRSRGGVRSHPAITA